jgi:hypothetical protein
MTTSGLTAARHTAAPHRLTVMYTYMSLLTAGNSQRLAAHGGSLSAALKHFVASCALDAAADSSTFDTCLTALFPSVDVRCSPEFVVDLSKTLLRMSLITGSKLLFTSQTADGVARSSFTCPLTDGKQLTFCVAGMMTPDLMYRNAASALVEGKRYAVPDWLTEKLTTVPTDRADAAKKLLTTTYQRASGCVDADADNLHRCEELTYHGQRKRRMFGFTVYATDGGGAVPAQSFKTPAQSTSSPSSSSSVNPSKRTEAPVPTTTTPKPAHPCQARGGQCVSKKQKRACTAQGKTFTKKIGGTTQCPSSSDRCCY